MPNRELTSSSVQATTLALPSNPSATLVTHAARLTKIEQDVIANLPDQNMEEVLNTRRNAKLLSETAWRIECACDAQIVMGAKNMRGRATHTGGDVEGRGVMAAVRRQAKKVGCTPSTIFKNSQIFRLIQQAESASPENSTLLRLLDERGYFVAALTAAEPLQALQLFVEKKRSLTRFRITDAQRLLDRQGLSKKVVTSAALENARESIPALSNRATEIEQINKAIDLVRSQILSECTNSEIGRIHESYIEELQDYMGEELFDQDAAMALRRAWRLGNHWESQLAKATKFPLEVVSREMRLLGSLGQFIQVPAGPKSGPDIRWHKVGEQLPPELRRKQN